eukprot:CAMPEP_0170196946 /NCGR_PEP_ID=MMETSP0040_2-20121228/65227_1 /TAXON_ID=641309 /ORGANISM="Lotharella oceanica, Strain CCMP622" /LENGTH=174 /DNA_ID=CAMNT_0010446523 /DNA_START=41 /DNA_END=565 /DNA_ORIENTATION=-
MKEKMPSEISKWKENPFCYRFPCGESQQDLVVKLQAFIHEIEGHVRPVLVISHISTLQVLYGYFLGHRFIQNRYHKLTIPHNVVIELTPSQYGWKEKRYDLTQFHYTDQDAINGATSYEGVQVQHNTNFYEECFRESKGDIGDSDVESPTTLSSGTEFLHALTGSNRGVFTGKR